MSEQDLDLYFELRNNPVVLAIPGREPRPRSEIAHQISWWMRSWRERGFGTWTVFERETDERLARVELGPVGEGWEGLSPDETEVGTIVHPDHWNRGIATEATDLVAADCFGRVGLCRLVALTTTDNKASLGALRKLRMRHVGDTRREDENTSYEVFEIVPPAGLGQVRC